MNWLWAILITAAISGVIAFFCEKDKKEKGKTALRGTIVGGIGCGYLILLIIFGITMLCLFIKLIDWLFA